jgi:hypothetical protein
MCAKFFGKRCLKKQDFLAAWPLGLLGGCSERLIKQSLRALYRQDIKKSARPPSFLLLKSWRLFLLGDLALRF